MGPPTTLRTDLRKGFAESLLSIPYVQIVGPTHFLVVAVLTQHFQLSAITFGFIAALPGWCAVLQFLVSAKITARLGARRASLAVQVLDLCIWTAVAVCSPWLRHASAEAAAILFVAIFASSQAVRCINRVAHPAWMREWVPAKVRGPFVAMRSSWSTVVLILFALAIVPLLRSAEPWKAYRIFLLVAVGMKIASLLLQLSIRTRAKSSVNEVPYSTGYLLNPRNWAEFMSGGRPFLMLTLLLAGTGFFRSITSPFRNLYLFNEVGFSAATVGTLAVVELTITAVAFPLWARLAKPLGYAAVLWLCLLGFILDSVLWALLPVSSSSAFYAVKAWGALCATGFALSMYTLQLDLMPKQHGAAYLSLAITVDAICGAIAPMLFGAALQVGPSGVMYQLGFLTTAGGVLMVMLVLWSRGGRWGGTAPRAATLPAEPLSASAVVKLAART